MSNRSPLTLRLRPGWLADQLPPAMLLDPTSDSPFLARFLRIFEDISAEIQEQIDELPHVFDPATADLRFVRWLGSWLGVDIDSSLPDQTQRQVVRAAGKWLGMRGTVHGLEGFVADITGHRCVVTDEGGVFGLDDDVPPSGGTVVVRVDGLGQLDRMHVKALIDRSLPIGSTSELSVESLPRAREW